MAGKKRLAPLRIASDDDAPLTVSRAFDSGTRLDELRAMYKVLAAHIDSENTLARDLAPLMRQAREISKEIESLEEQESEEGGAIDAAADGEWKPQVI